MQQPLKVCPGADSVAQSLSLLKSNSKNITPLKANGRCRAKFYADNKKYDESFNVKIWVNPQNEIYMQGDIFFDPKGIVLGSNAQQFWLLIKPELSSYTWGKWNEQNLSQKLIIDPKTLLEALGFVDLSDRENWSLSSDGPFDILTGQDNGRVVKKIYVSNCDYLVRKIEYFDIKGQTAAVAELNKYKQLAEGFFVPHSIKIINCPDGDMQNSIGITLTLTSVKPATFTDKQRNRLFNRPQPRGFKHIYRSIDGKIIEQQQ